jgi:hypothetical protein
VKRIYEIENWCLLVIDKVKNQQPIEDSRVELKSDWIDEEKAARRIAGHANASRGEPILWIIGLDETEGVVGINSLKFIDWYAKVKSNFDGISPDVIDLDIVSENKIIKCLYFITERIPFLVKNSVYGKKGGGPVSFEVPWREGTEVRTATRNELIKILSPIPNRPRFEIQDGSIDIRQFNIGFSFYLNLDLYVEKEINQDVQIPFHKCQASIVYGVKKELIELTNIIISPPWTILRGDSQYQSSSITIKSTPDEMIVSGSGRIFFKASNEFVETFDLSLNNIDLYIQILPIGFENPINLHYKLIKCQSHQNSISLYKYFSNM